jgi:hypothetical protein
MVEYTIRISSHSQLCTLSAQQVSQYGASEMGIRDNKQVFV